MRVINLQQGTPEWLAWRREGIGASDAPVILGVSPFGMAKRLWEVKTGQRQPDEANYSMRRGHELEPVARQLYVERTGNVVEPCCVQHDEFPWMKASLDGMDLAGVLIAEVKCGKIEDHKVALGGAVPPHYIPQVQHQLYITGAGRCDYISYSEHSKTKDADKLAVVEVFPDAEYIETLLRAERKFWAAVETRRWFEEE